MPPQAKRKYTRMSSDLASQIRALIEDAEGQHLQRRRILTVIGEDKTALFDNWAKKNLQNLGRRLGYGLIGVDYGEQCGTVCEAKHSIRWAPEDYMRLAKEYVDTELLETAKVTRIDPHTLGIALSRCGITKPVPKGLKVVLAPYIPSARGQMVVDLMTTKETIKTVKVPVTWSDISDEDLLRELYRRLPAVISSYNRLPAGGMTPLPAPEPPAPIKVKPEPFKIVVVGIHPPDRPSFERRTKIKAQLDNHRLELIFAESGRTTPTGDFTVVVGNPFREVYKNLRRIRGDDRVVFATSASTAEPEVLSAIPLA